MSKNHNRDQIIDVAKGLGIVFVVVGHINSETLKTLQSFVYQFHVPLFFILSGIFLEVRTDMKAFAIKRFKRLYIPAILWNTIFYILIVILQYYTMNNKVAIADFLKHNILQLFGLRTNALGGAIWFLYTLMRASIIYALIEKFLRTFITREQLHLSCIAVVSFAIGFLTQLPFELEKDFVGLFFMCIGRCYYISGAHIAIINQRSLTKSIIVTVSALILIISLRYNTFDIAYNNYGHFYISIGTSLLGTLMTICVSSIITIESASVRKYLCYIGQKSMWILIGHFAAFKIVILFEILYYHVPMSNIFAHPTFNAYGIWSVLYVAIGIFLPVLTSIIYKKYIISKRTCNQ